MFAMRFGAGNDQQARLEAGRGYRTTGRRGQASALSTIVAGALTVVACGHSKAALPPTTIATTTTSTTLPAVSSLMVDGVRPGVLQAPFFPQVSVTQVSCGVGPTGGRFVRIDVPAGGAGTPAKSVLTKATAVIVVPGAAVLVDPRFVKRALYAEAMKSIATSTKGSLVLTMANLQKAGGDGLTVQVGNVRVIGDYECPATDVAYPGT